MGPRLAQGAGSRSAAPSSSLGARSRKKKECARGLSALFATRLTSRTAERGPFFFLSLLDRASREEADGDRRWTRGSIWRCREKRCGTLSPVRMPTPPIRSNPAALRRRQGASDAAFVSPLDQWLPPI